MITVTITTHCVQPRSMTQHLQSYAKSRNVPWEQALMRCGRRRVVYQQSREMENKSVRADSFADGFQFVCASNDEGLLRGYTQRSRTFLIATTPTQHHHREPITATIHDPPHSGHPNTQVLTGCNYDNVRNNQQAGDINRNCHNGRTTNDTVSHPPPDHTNYHNRTKFTTATAQHPATQTSQKSMKTTNKATGLWRAKINGLTWSHQRVTYSLTHLKT